MTRTIAWLIFAGLIALCIWSPWTPAIQQLDVTPPYFIGTWKNVSSSDTTAEYYRFEALSALHSLNGYEEKLSTLKILRRRGSDSIFIQLKSGRLELTPKGDDLIYIGEWIPTGINDDVAFFEKGYFARRGR